MDELEKLSKIYLSARDNLLNKIINTNGVGTKTYYNTILKSLNNTIDNLQKQTGAYINTAIPYEYQQALDETYDYFKKNNLQMKSPSAFAQIHNEAIYVLAR